MGIEKLAGRLPRKRVDYLKVRRTKGAAMVVRIDAAGALWLCAYRSKETYAFGDFFAAWARWQRGPLQVAGLLLRRGVRLLDDDAQSALFVVHVRVRRAATE